MADRDKVIKGLNDIGSFIANRLGYEQARNYFKTIDDALVLLKEQETMIQCIRGKCRICPHCASCDIDENGVLKEQEPIKPRSKSRHGSTTMYQHFCGNCMAMLHGKPKYCPNCGRVVKWE